MKQLRTGVFLIAVTVAAISARAQNRGQDAAKFELTHFNTHGQWDLFCGHFGDPKTEKCDLRRTDILNPRPKFRAMVIYIRFEKDGPVINVDAERSTSWVGGGLKVDGVFHYRMDGCLIGRCPLRGGVAAGFVEKLAKAKSISLNFVDILERREVDWDLKDLRSALAELAALRKKKGLP